jgi:glutathione S-transferase
MPQTMLWMLVAGLKYPNAATAVGAAWVFFRTLYLYGYVFSGRPNGAGRAYGSPFWLCQGALCAMSVFGVGLPMMKLGIFGH